MYGMYSWVLQRETPKGNPQGNPNVIPSEMSGNSSEPYRPTKCLRHYLWETPCHAGSGSKQSHVVNSEPMGSINTYCIISINKHCLIMKNKYVIQSHIYFMMSVFGLLKTQNI